MNHGFNTEIAKEYDIETAIIIENMYFWIKKNEANEKHFHDGKYWTYNSVSAFSKIFDYMSEGKIRRTLDKMRKEGLIETGNYNKSAYDRTLWYSLTNKALCKMGESICQIKKIDLAPQTNLFSTSDEPIPVINTVINTNINTNINSKKQPIPKPIKKRFELPKENEVIDYAKEKGYIIDPHYFYDYYSQSDWEDVKGNKIKNWKLKMLTWEKREEERNPNRRIIQKPTEESLIKCAECGSIVTAGVCTGCGAICDQYGQPVKIGDYW